MGLFCCQVGFVSRGLDGRTCVILGRFLFSARKVVYGEKLTYISIHITSEHRDKNVCLIIQLLLVSSMP